MREALQRLETQGMLTRDGRSLIVASLDHNQLAELYTVRAELEGLAARLAARHATDEEVRVLRGMVEDDHKLLGGDPRALARANKRFHKLIHLASHNRFLVQQLDLVHRAMARVHKEAEASGRLILFAALSPFVLTEPEPGAYERVAAELHLSRSAVAMAVHRLRLRLRELVRSEIAETLINHSAVETEMQELMAALRK